MKRFLLLVALLLAPLSGYAQCLGSGGINTINDCPAAVSIQLGDELFSYQIGQSPHTRKMTAAQVLSLLSAGSGVNIATVGNSVVISATGNSVNPGLANQLAWYSSSGTVVGGLTMANNGVLVTDGSGVPSISTTLPTGLALGIPASLTLTNATGLPVGGLTGLGSGVASALALASSGTGGLVRTTSPTLITPALGTPTALVLTNATGLPNSGLINASTTVNGVVCTLGSTCAISATAASITPGTTSIVGGVSGNIEYNNGGTLGELAPTGTGNVVLATSPTIATPTVTGSFTATGLVTNADLVSPSVTVNGVTCTLGSSCSPGAAATSIGVGSTLVTTSVNGRVLFDAGGTLGEYPINGTGAVVLANSPSLIAPNLGTPTAIALTNATGLPNSGLINSTMTVNGVTCTLGSTCTPPGVTSITPTLVAANVTANGTLGTLPANGFLGPYLLLTETAGTSANIAIGTTLAGSDVLPTQTVPANGSLTVDITAFSKGWFSPSATQTLYLTTSGGGSSVTAQLFYWVIGTTGGGAGGGVTSVGVSTPGSTLTLGGTNPVTGTGTISADINLAHPNTWTGQQTFASPIVTGAFTATGLVTNADLVNSSTTINGTSCTLGSSCTVTASTAAITVGTTTIAGGTNGRVEFNNAGVLGEIATTGSGNVVLANSPTLVSPALGTPASGVATNLTGTAAGLTAGTATNQSGGFVAATTLSASSTVTGNGFIARFASPGPIGNTAPSTGAFTTLSASGQITSTLATGTAPFAVASTTNVANLNASSLGGATFASPGPIGSTSASTGAFTTLSASSTVSGAGFTARFASPGPIGNTAASTGNFTTLGTTSDVSVGGALGVTGTSTFNGAVTVAAAGGLTVSAGNIFVQGAGTVQSYLQVIGSNTTAAPSGWFYSPSGAAASSPPSLDYGISSIFPMLSAGFFANSDVRVKSDIRRISPEEGVAFVELSSPVRYRKQNREEAGFLAQDQVRAGYGQYVLITPNKELSERIDKDGFVSRAGVELNLNYNNYVAYLAAALQNALARIEVLEARR